MKCKNATFFHIVDHEGFGTIHKLIIPLCEKYIHHQMIDIDKLIKFNPSMDSIFIIHSTGALSDEVKWLVDRFRVSSRFFIFLHTSYNYQKIKKREDIIYELREWMRKRSLVLLVPSIEVQQQYEAIGFSCNTIQLGVKLYKECANITEFHEELSVYYDRIVTTCSSEKEIYRYVKGIDIFESAMESIGLTSKALVAGIDNKECGKIEWRSFEEVDFLNVLYHSKAYVQFSRYESYNLTAVYAKQMGVPVFVYNTEGVKSCLAEVAYDECEKLISDLVLYVNDDVVVYDIIGKQNQSLNNESICRMNDSFLRLIRR